MAKGKEADVPQVKLIAVKTGVENLSSEPQSPPSQIKKSIKDLEETPPPSRPPSPPPSPTNSAKSRDSDWSIEIEELTDKPDPAVQSKKGNQRPDRQRSSSWSRSLMNSFRKKKNKEKEANLEDLYKTGPLPDDFPAECEGVENECIEPDGTAADEERKEPDKNVQINESHESDWSIEIEELTEEPRSAVQSKKENKRLNRRRSNSWSRSLMNSFKKTKKEKEANLEDLRHHHDDPLPDDPLPDDFPAKCDEEASVKNESIEPDGTAADKERRGPDGNVEIGESIEERTAPGPVPNEAVTVAEIRAKVPAAERSNRISKMLSFGTFGKRKSMTITQEQTKNRQERENQEIPEIKTESKQEKKYESKLEAKGKADKKGKHDEADGESGQRKPESKTKSNKEEKSKSKERKTNKNLKEKSEENSDVTDEMQIEAESVLNLTVAKVEENDKKLISNVKNTKSNNKSIFSLKSKSVEQVQPEIDINAVQISEQHTDFTLVTKSEFPASVKPKRKTIGNLFKREKSIKGDYTTRESISDVSPLKKTGMFRNSFSKSKKTKSMDVETNSHEGTPEKEKKTHRSTSMAFGSSFSLKKIFQSDPLELVENPGSKGILNKRNKRTPSSRPKSVQLDDYCLEFENAPTASERDLVSSRNKLGERFMSFTKDSLRIKKRQRSKTDEQTQAEIEDETCAVPITIGAEIKSVTSQDVTEVELEGKNAREITTYPVAESVSSKVDEAAILSTLHLDYEPKHALVSSSLPTSPGENPTNSDVHSNTGIHHPPTLLDASKADNPTPDEQQKAVAVSSVKRLKDIFLIETLEQVLGQLKTSPSSEGAQLREIFENPHLTALLETHDAVTEKLPGYPPRQGSFIESPNGRFDPYSWEMPADISDVRAVGIRKNPGEPLGLTVKTEDGQLVIARILAGGAVDRQGLLHVGDIIGEVNGVVVRSAEQLQVEIARCREHIQLKILPSFQENGSNGAQVGQSPSTILASETLNSVSVCCVRAHFDYDPKEDKLLPCPEIGLAFKKGDILQVVNQSDPNWWQAKKVGWSGPAGLIPSQELEERRKAFVAPEADFVHKIGFCGTRISKKKKKMMYQIKSSIDLDKAELLLYEEVTRMPPFRRKTLVLVGSEGIGRRTLKNRLINSDPDRFGTTMPHTSRPMRELEEDGMGYWFVSREEMEHDVRDHQFLEFGEHNNHIYGTKLDTIRAVIRQGKMCVLDCSPNALKTLHNSPEFMPYVIFLAAPGMDQLKSLYENSRYSSRNLGTFDRSSSIRFSSRRARTLESLTSLYEEEDFKNALEESARIQRIYEKYFDQIIVNEDPDQTFRKVVEALEILSNQHQWVPVSWVY